MKKFLVLYRVPVAVIEEWMKKPQEERKEANDRMMLEWRRWVKEHKATVKETAGAGKTKRLTRDGVEDAKNDVMLFSFVEAESHEEAADLFKDHPHLDIPESSIEVMPVNDME